MARSMIYESARSSSKLFLGCHLQDRRIEGPLNAYCKMRLFELIHASFSDGSRQQLDFRTAGNPTVSLQNDVHIYMWNLLDIHISIIYVYIGIINNWLNNETHRMLYYRIALDVQDRATDRPGHL